MSKAKFQKVVYSADRLVGEYHDAHMCTFDGRDCVVSSICLGSKILDTHESHGVEEAEKWVIAELVRRTGHQPKRMR